MKATKLKFAVLLPLFQLLMALGALAYSTLQIHLVSVELEDSKTGKRHIEHRYTADPSKSDIRVSGNQVILLGPLDLSNRREPTFPSPLETISILNLPGLIGEIAIDLPTTWPDSWHPELFDLWQWRAVTWPLFCLLFGWEVGRALDVLCGSILSIRIWEAVPLFALSIFLFAFVIGTRATGTHGVDDRLTRWMLAGASVWATLFLLPSVAWYRRFRDRRKSRLSAAPS